MRLPDQWQFGNRFGRPQLYALLLLAAFALQCFWAAERPVLGREEWHWVQADPAGDVWHSPLVYGLARLPLRLRLLPPLSPEPGGPAYESAWLLRLPFVLLGLLRGASLWYVARRLCGNRGGYYALALYCFSPRMVAEASRVGPDVLAAWGFFGALFTGIARAHTLYAPAGVAQTKALQRELLMGAALGLGIAASFSVVLAVPLTLACLLYLVPERRRAIVPAMLVGGAVAVFILFAAYGFEPLPLARALRHAAWGSLRMRPLGVRFPALLALWQQTNFAFLALVAVALVTWLLWRRARYFGNTVALVVLAAVPLFAPVYPPEPFRLWTPAVAFVFLFIGGLFADLLESPLRKPALVAGVALLLADIGLSLQRTLEATATH